MMLVWTAGRGEDMSTPTAHQLVILILGIVLILSVITVSALCERRRQRDGED